MKLLTVARGLNSMPLLHKSRYRRHAFQCEKYISPLYALLESTLTSAVTGNNTYTSRCWCMLIDLLCYALHEVRRKRNHDKLGVTERFAGIISRETDITLERGHAVLINDIKMLAEYGRVRGIGNYIMPLCRAVHHELRADITSANDRYTHRLFRLGSRSSLLPGLLLRSDESHILVAIVVIDNNIRDILKAAVERQRVRQLVFNLSSDDLLNGLAPYLGS